MNNFLSKGEIQTNRIKNINFQEFKMAAGGHFGFLMSETDSCDIFLIYFI